MQRLVFQRTLKRGHPVIAAFPALRSVTAHSFRPEKSIDHDKRSRRLALFRILAASARTEASMPPDAAAQIEHRKPLNLSCP